jgi:uncharacterized membrane protein YfcA
MNKLRQSLLCDPDRLGIVASAVCFIHCLATPVLLSVSAVWAHFLASEERFHRGIAMLVAALGCIAIAAGYRRHRRRRIIFLMAAGLLCIFFGAYFGDRLPSHAAEVVVTMMGSALMIAAHRLNHTFCRDCPCCNTGSGVN